MKRTLRWTPAFTRSFKRFVKKHPDLRDALAATLALLEADAFHPSLKTHRLQGALKGVWACSAGYDLRILFEVTKDRKQEYLLLHNVGTHDEVY